MRPPKSCLVLGSGMGGLAAGALLARAGVEVTVLEAHPELVGGCAHTFRVNGYKFTAGPRYLWNFGPGEIGQRFLAKCALQERVPMTELDRAGFDHIYIGDDEPVRVPNGWSAYEELLKDRFPAEARGIGRFFGLCRRTFRLVEVIEEQRWHLDPLPRVFWKCFWRRPGATAWVLLRKDLTVRGAFDACGLSPQLRTVLYGHGGVFGLPAEALSFHAYAGATLFYHRGCYYPVHDFDGLVGALAETIGKRNGRILCGRRVVSVRAGARGVEHVATQTGERWSADAVVVNFDPRTFLGLVDGGNGRAPARPPAYSYSRSVSSLFLGVTDARALSGTFGKWNIWYCSDTRPAPNLYDSHPLDPPRMLYLNSPTLVKGRDNDAPPGHATVTAFAATGYAAWKGAAPAEKEALRQRHTSLLLDAIERRFVPGLRGRLGAVHLRTPEDKERIWLAPGGNIYGPAADPRSVWRRMPFRGTIPGLYFVGSYVSFAGIATVLHGACRLYQELTGDTV